MAVTQVGTPSATVYTTTNGTNTPTLAWSGTQPRTAGDILVLVVTAAATTSVTAPATPAGWTAGPAVGNAATAHAYVAIFWKIATSGDAVPSISVTTSGTTRCGFSLFELTGAENILSPVDSMGTYASGSSSATIASMTVTSSANVRYSGEYGFAAFARESSAATTATYTAGSGWTNFSNDGSTSSRDKNAVDYTTSAPTIGVTLSDAATITSAGTAYAAGALIAFTPPHDPGPVLVPCSQPPGVRVSYAMAGYAMASVISSAPVIITPAPLYPLTQPVDGSRRTARPPRGIVRGIAGAALFTSLIGPPLTPLHAPIASTARQARPPAGHVIKRTGTFSGVGPAVTPLHKPVTSAVRVLPPHGTVTKRSGQFSGTGPQLKALSGPVKATQPLPPRGVTYSRTGTYSGIGPALTPLHAPVRAVPAKLPGGRTYTLRVVQVTAPAVSSTLYPLHAPVTSVVRRLPPAGRNISRTGTYSGVGPALRPLTSPVKSRRPLPPRGVAYSRAGIYSGTGPKLRPLNAPVRVRQQPPTLPGRAFTFSYLPLLIGSPAPPLTQPRGARVTYLHSGHVQSTPIALPALAPTIGPQLTPLHAPVRAALPAAHQRGYTTTHSGVYSGTGPAVTSLKTPVKGQPAQQLRGHAITTPAHAAVIAPTSGPQLYPLHQPIRSQLALPAPGRAAAITAILFYASTSTSGPAISPRTSPWRAVIPASIRGGTSHGSQGTFSGTGATFKSASQPAGVLIALLRTGHVQSSYITSPPIATGPVIPPRAQPWRAAIPAPIRGGWSRSATGLFSGVGPGLIPLKTPVRARQPLPGSGRVLGAYRAIAQLPAPTSGPPLTPLHQPVRGRLPLPPPGRAATMALLGFIQTAPATGPAIPPRAQPVRAIIPIPARGGWTRSSVGTRSGVGSVVTALTGPIQERRPLPPRGRIFGIVRVTAQAPSPSAGPTLYPLRQPIRARQPLPSPGRAATMSLLGVTPGVVSSASISPRATPWRASIPAAIRGGNTRSNRGIYSGQGPALAPLHAPITIRRSLPSEGRILGIAHPAPPPAPTSGPSVYPLRQPVRAPIPQHIHGGYTRSSKGIRSGIGPALRPLTAPLRTSWPLPPAGHAQGTHRGIYSGTGPATTPLHRPVTSIVRIQPPAGKSITRVGAYSGQGPALRPLTSPMVARHPLPPRGHILGVYTVIVLPPPPTPGPPIPPRAVPIRATIPQPIRGGWTRTSGPYVPPIPPPPAPGAFVVNLGSPYLSWQTGPVNSSWMTGVINT